MHERELATRARRALYALGALALVVAIVFALASPGRASRRARRAEPTARTQTAAALRTPADADRRPAPGQVLVTGVVRDAAGAPVPRASVSARVVGPRELPSVTGEADDLGRYELAVAVGQWVVRAAKPGYAAEEAWVIATRDAAVDLVLARGAAILGRVVASDGAAVAGATVLVDRRAGGALDTALATTDASGAFELHDLRAGEHDVAAARGSLYGRVARAVTLRPGEVVSGLVIEVARAASISGRVRSPSGEPIAGARVDAVAPAVQASATSGPDGAFKIDGVPAGALTLTASAPGHAGAEKKLAISAGHDERAVELVLADEIVLSGRVLAPRGGTVAGARVLAGDRATTTGYDGKFAVHVPAAAVVALRAEHETGFAQMTLDPGGGAVDDIALTLSEWASVAGRVAHDDGAAVQGAVVRAGEAMTTTDAAGEFVLAHVAPGQVVVRASEANAVDAPGPRDDGGAPNASVVRTLVAGERASGIELVLPRRTASIAGTVVDANGRPVVGATVGAIYEDDLEDPGAAAGAIAEQIEDGRTLSRSGEGGAFAIRELEPGATFVVWAKTDGRPSVSVAHVEAGRMDVRLVLAAPTRLAGIVSAPDGTPQPSYRLLVRGASADGAPKSPEAHVVQDARGEFSLEGLEPGTYSLLAQTADGRAAKLDAVVLGAGEEKAGLRLVTAPGIALEGRILDAASKRPLAGVHVVVIGQVGEAETDAWGAFRVSGLAADGDVRLYADEPSGEYLYDARGLDLSVRQGRIAVGDVWMLRAPSAEPEGETGLTCESWDGRVVVAEVRPGATGEAAGVRAGDRVVAVEGVPAAPFGDPALDAMLRGSVGTSVSITIARGYAGVRRISIIRAPAPR